MGGTFMSLPPDYRDYFIRNLHDALSGEFFWGFACRLGFWLQTGVVPAAAREGGGGGRHGEGDVLGSLGQLAAAGPAALQLHSSCCLSLPACS